MAKKSNVKSYKIIGYTEDGIPLLKPKMKPIHFTIAQIRGAIKDIRNVVGELNGKEK